MIFNIGGRKLEISHARLNYCRAYQFHMSFMENYGEKASSEGLQQLYEMIASKEEILFMIKALGTDPGLIALEFAKSYRFTFDCYKKLYSKHAVRFLNSIDCLCYEEDEYFKTFTPNPKEYMEKYLENTTDKFFRELLEDIGKLIDNLGTQLQVCDSGFATTLEVAQRQDEAIDQYRPKLLNLVRKFHSRRDISEAYDEAFSKMFQLLLIDLCKAATLAGDKFACQPIPIDTLKLVWNACEQLESHNIKESDITACCLFVLQNAPFFAIAYPPLYARVGDKSGDLIRLGEMAGVCGIRQLRHYILPHLYSHTRISELSDIDAFRKSLYEQWTFYGLDNDPEFDDKPEEWIFYQSVKRNFEMIRSTFHRQRFASPEIAAHYRAVYELICDSDFTTSQKNAEASRNAVMSLARSFNIPTDWLEPILEAKAKSLEVRLYDDLRKYLESVDLSTEEKAIAARSALRNEALRIGYTTFGTYPPLEKLIARYDQRARTVLNREFQTREEAEVQRQIFNRIAAVDFQSSAEVCRQALDECVGMAAKVGIDAEWLLSDLRTALRRHDEESRVRLGYLYDSNEEAENVLGNSNLVFRAIWAAIKRFSLSNAWLCSRDDLSAGTLSRLTKRANVPAEDIFVYYNSGIFTSGQIGMWICKMGIGVCNGSVFAEKLLKSRMWSRLIPIGLQERLKNYIPRCAILRWSSFVGVGTEVVRITKAGLELPEGVKFTCSQKKAIALKGLFDEFHAIGAEITCDLAQGASEVPAFEQVCSQIQFTDWPSKREEESDSPMTLNESDFSDNRPVEPETLIELEDYSSSIEMIVEDSLGDATAAGVKTASDLTPKDTAIFTSKPNDGVSIAHEDIICMTKKSGLFKKMCAYALTDSYFLMAIGEERHAYHLAELLSVPLGEHLSSYRYRCVHSQAGGKILCENIPKIDDNGGKYILKVIRTFQGLLLE